MSSPEAVPPFDASLQNSPPPLTKTFLKATNNRGQSSIADNKFREAIQDVQDMTLEERNKVAKLWLDDREL